MSAVFSPSAADLARNKGPAIIGVNIMVAILATVAVALRLLARRMQKLKLQADDYSIIVTVPLGWAMCVCTIIAVHNGLGRHITTLTPRLLAKEGKALFAAELIWAVSIPIIKISILLLYIRLFGRLRYIRLWAYGLGAFSVCCGMMFLLVCAFQCRPLQFTWDKSIDGTCIETGIFLIAGSAPNVLTDILVLVLPLRAVWNLQMTRLQKISLTGIFMLGSITCLISLVRFIELIQNAMNPDVTWSLGMTGLLTTAELCLGIVAACLSTMRPLFIKIISQGKKGGTGVKASGHQYYEIVEHPKLQTQRRDGRVGSKPLYNNSYLDSRIVTSITGVPAEESVHDLEAKGIPLNAIEVRMSTSVID